MLPWAWARFALFVLVFLISFALFFYRQNVVDRRREHVQARLETSQRQLEAIPDLVRTMPPESFLQDLGITLEKCEVMNAASGNERAAVLESVAASLKGIAALARAFDTTSSSSTFGANVMVFIPADEASAWASRIKFMGHAEKLSGFKGALVLCHDLTATDRGAPDGNLAEMALPVPLELGTEKDASGKGGWRPLPGAPMAFCRKSFEHFSSTRDVANWARKHADFTSGVLEEVDSYFSSTSAVQGMLSCPLFAPNSAYQDRRDREVIGVLNVHWAGAARLSQKRSGEIFADAIFPLRLLLSQQLQVLNEIAGLPRPKETT